MPSPSGTISWETITVLASIVFFFFAGTFHPAFWILSAMISFVASVSLTVDFPPPSMIPFVFVAYGLMVLIVAVARIMVGDTSGRQRR